MKTRISLSIILTLLIWAGCTKDNDVTIVASGNVTIEKYPFADYTSLQVSDAFDVRLYFADNKDEVVIHADDNIHPYLDIRMVGNELIIGVKGDVTIAGQPTLSAYLTAETIKQISGSGASRIYLDNELHEPVVDILLSGASFMTGTIINENVVTAELSGASSIDLSGETKMYAVIASGASRVQKYGFVTEFLDIDLSGASDAWVTVNKEIAIIASGGSTLYYKGTTTFASMDLSGGSQVVDEN